MAQQTWLNFSDVAHRWPLPVPLPRLEGEALSSYVVRLADVHGQSTQAFGFWLLGRGRSIFGEDIDRGAWPVLVERLAYSTCQPVANVYGGTCKVFDSHLWESVPANGPARWILPIVKCGTHRKGFGQQYCPECLASDERPFLRLGWRLAFHVWCPVHRHLLRDRCAACDEPVTPHRYRTGTRRPIGQSGITHCSRCDRDRRLDTPSDDMAFDPAGFALQEQMIDALRTGYAVIDGRPVFAQSFFAGTAMLWSLLDDDPKSARLWSLLGEPEAPHATPGRFRYGSFEKRSVSRRAKLLRGCAQLLEGGEAAMIGRLEGAGANASTVFRYIGHLRMVPFWLWEPVHTRLDRSMYVPSEPEVRNVVDHVRRSSSDGFARVSEICALLGLRTRSSARICQLMRQMHAIKRSSPKRNR